MLANLFRMVKLKSKILGKELITTSDGHAGEEVHEAPMLEQYGFASVPPNGADGIALMPDGYSENAVTVFFDSPQHKPTIAEGEVCVYDKFGNKIVLKNGQITINCAGSINITSSGNLSITAPMTTINGNLTVNGTIIN